ncbi:MAG: hypothetical protein EXR55_04865, partial [Dehalococcoidia bacterium]|nr:hypothetical protein [Dehalococcoidia bacterium]
LLHSPTLPGSPDLVVPSRQKLIFVRGCFWHRHEGCAKSQVPKSRPTYWLEKFDRNVKRDRDLHRARRTARRLFYQLLAGLPFQPDPEINQVVQQLQSMNAKLEAPRIAKNNQCPKLTIKGPAPESPSTYPRSPYRGPCLRGPAPPAGTAHHERPGAP